MIIKRYSDADESPLFDMMKEEGMIGATIMEKKDGINI